MKKEAVLSPPRWNLQGRSGRSPPLPYPPWQESRLSILKKPASDNPLEAGSLAGYYDPEWPGIVTLLARQYGHMQ